MKAYTMDSKYQRALDQLNSFKRLYGSKVVKIMGIANQHIFLTLTDGMTAGVPQPANMNGKKIWSVPILLSSNKNSATEIGVIFIDDETKKIIGATDRETVMQNAFTLNYEETEMV
ncbi:hypothetical protein H8E88_21130 [candidate division KSB1 bacterium]|nr:hypothetical protein [candidate division KSB1 bacterium]